jgi:hypothetical protein
MTTRFKTYADTEGEPDRPSALTRAWRAWRDPSHVAFATGGDVQRIFIACTHCGRVQPHYRAYPPPGSPETGKCKCGWIEFRPVKLAEWRAAWWVLVVGWCWRKTIKQETQWDPRMPWRTRL